jgi:pyridoxal phosphate enzyme (YggS family)
MNYNELKQQFPNLHEIVAVSKTFDCASILSVFNQGFRHFGENKVQELLSKKDCHHDIIWHFIGHLQSNKVKDVVKVAQWIDSVDSIKLLDLINKECIKLNKNMNILIQVKLTDEETKSGVNPSDLDQLLQHAQLLSHIKCKGLMIIGPNTDNASSIKQVFQSANELFKETQKKYPEITELSMGMSHDYKIAYDEGSTMFRIGSLLFGQRR